MNQWLILSKKIFKPTLCKLINKDFRDIWSSTFRLLLGSSQNFWKPLMKKPLPLERKRKLHKVYRSSTRNMRQIWAKSELVRCSFFILMGHLSRNGDEIYLALFVITDLSNYYWSDKVCNIQWNNSWSNKVCKAEIVVQCNMLQSFLAHAPPVPR